MPRVDPAEFASLSLHASSLVDGFALHDVWLVELDGASSLGLLEMRRLFATDELRSVGPLVRLLFSVRSALGWLFRLDAPASRPRVVDVAATVPPGLARISLVPPGTPDGPFKALYVLHDEAAYEAVNATVHAVLVIALTRTDAGNRFFWATYIRPVGRITPLYMRLIDPFRRMIVYPGLESWLKRRWPEVRSAGLTRL